MKRAEQFDPLTVPTVTDLLREVDQAALSNGDGDSNGFINDANGVRKVNEWEKTSLKPYCDLFDGFVKTLLKAEAVRVKRERDDDGSDLYREVIAS